MGYAVDMSLRLIDGVSPVYAAMGRASNNFATAQGQAFRKGNRDMSRMMATAKGFVIGRGALAGINMVRSGISELTREWVAFDNASRFAASKFEEVTTGAMSFEAALAATKQTSIEVSAVTMFTASQVAKAMDNMALSGYTLSQSQAAVLDVTKFATLAQMDLTEATEASTGALGAFNLKTADSKKLAGNFSYLMDVMTATFTTSRMDLAQLTGAITAGGAAFVTSSQDIETFNTMLFAMAEGGIVGEKAGMRMRAIINRLGKPTKEASAAIAHLGLNIADAQGNFRPMLQVIDELRVGLSKYGTRERGAFIKTIFGERNITGINLILNKSKGELDSYYKHLIGAAGAADAQMKRVQGSMAQRLLILKSVITARFFSGMETAENPLSGLVSDMILSVQKFDMTKINEFIASELPKFISEMQSSVKRLLPDFVLFVKASAKLFALLLDYAPLIMTVVKGLVYYKLAMIALAVAQGILAISTSAWIVNMGIAATLVLLEIQKSGILAGAKYALAIAQGALNAAMLAFPAYWIVAAIAAVLFSVYALTYGWEKFGTKITSFWEKVRPILYLMSFPLAVIIDMVITLRNNWAQITQAFTEGGLIKGIQAIGGTILSSLLNPIELVLMALNKVGLFPDDAFESFKKLKNGLLDAGQTEMTINERYKKSDLYVAPQSAKEKIDAGGYALYNPFPEENSQYVAPNAGMADMQQRLMGTINLTGNTAAVDSATMDTDTGVNFNMGPN